MVSGSVGLAERYNVLSINVISSNAIANRTSQVTRHLSTSSDDSKSCIVTLRAKASVANKLISITEIAKRDLVQSGKKVYQYSSLGSEIVELKPAKKSSIKTGPLDPDTPGADGVLDEEEAFQTMEEAPKIRNMPVLTVHLSSVPIKELREAHGYVTY